jgi:hypothetical protein
LLVKEAADGTLKMPAAPTTTGDNLKQVQTIAGCANKRPVGVSHTLVCTAMPRLAIHHAVLYGYKDCRD